MTQKNGNCCDDGDNAATYLWFCRRIETRPPRGMCSRRAAA